MAGEDQRRPRTLLALDKGLNVSRFPGLWTLLLIPYVPFGLLLLLVRVCMSLQAVLLLLLFPEGKIKRFMLRVFFGVLGIVVTTDGFTKISRDAKLFISNKLSHIDHIVLHLSLDCITASTGGSRPPFSWLFQHRVFQGRSEESVCNEAKELPEFDARESVVDFTPYAIQPEFMPTNGSNVLLKFCSWPFSLDTVLHPVAISVSRPFGIKMTTSESNAWWDLLWTLFLPCTVFHVKCLPVFEAQSVDHPEETAGDVQEGIATELDVQASEIDQEDVHRWKSDPPKPPPPVAKPAQQHSRLPEGPVVPLSVSLPSSSSSSEQSSPPAVESMVQQVTAVLPQVPHIAIRKDLQTTNSVDVTITNILEGRVEYEPIPTLHEASGATVRTARGGAGGTGGGGVRNRGGGGELGKGGGLFGSSSVLVAMQRQLSLEDRKKQFIETAKRRYIEKHKLN